MADVAANLKDWSTTASSNSPTDATTIGAGLADNFQQVQATVRQDLASKGADIASASTTDLGAVAGHQHDITGTTTITSFGTVAAGIWKIIKFEGALTLTHNATSLILPGGVNITTADGDVAVMVSEGSGNWRCVSYQRAAIPKAGFTSAAQTITAAGSLTLAHGLGVIPNNFGLTLKCTSADNNYSVGDIIFVPVGQSYDGATSRGVSIVADATNLNVRFASGVNTFLYMDKTTGGLCSLTNSKWEAYFRAWVM